MAVSRELGFSRKLETVKEDVRREAEESKIEMSESLQQKAREIERSR